MKFTSSWRSTASFCSRGIFPTAWSSSASRRDVAQLLLLTAAGLLFTAGYASGAPATPRPNIVLILADDMGYSDIGYFGGEAQTPNIDRLADEGIRFTQFYNMPRCSPTRAALLTGLDSHQAGMGEVPEYGPDVGGPGYLSHLNNQCVTIAEVLRGAGYATYMSGKWHLGRERPHWPVDRGFDESTALIDCCSNFFGDPEANEQRKPASRRERYGINGDLWRPPLEGFYSTDWFGTNAARMIRERRSARAIPTTAMELAGHTSATPRSAWTNTGSTKEASALPSWRAGRTELPELG